MEKVYPFFPLSAGAEPGNPKRFVLTLAIYLVACGVLRVLCAILGWIPLVGWLLELIFSLMGIYCVVGLVLAIVKFCEK